MKTATIFSPLAGIFYLLIFIACNGNSTVKSETDGEDTTGIITLKPAYDTITPDSIHFSQIITQRGQDELADVNSYKERLLQVFIKAGDKVYNFEMDKNKTTIINFDDPKDIWTRAEKLKNIEDKEAKYFLVTFDRITGNIETLTVKDTSQPKKEILAGDDLVVWKKN